MSGARAGPSNMLFPAWGIPDAAMRFLLWVGLLGFPVALVFGWMFDISTEGIRRTQPVGSQEELLRSLPLRRPDYAILAALLVVVGAIIYDTTGRVLETTTTASPGEPDEWRPSAAEVEPHSLAVLPFCQPECGSGAGVLCGWDLGGDSESPGRVSRVEGDCAHLELRVQGQWL
jgi:hypothetical protein